MTDFSEELNRLIQNKNSLKDCSKEFRSAEQPALFAIRLEPINYYYVGENLKNSKEFALKVFALDMLGKPYFTAAKILGFMPPFLRDDEEVVLASALVSPFSFEYASSRLHKDTDFIKSILSRIFSLYSVDVILNSCDESVKNNKEFMLSIMNKDASVVFKHCSSTLKKDKDIITCAVLNGYLDFASFDESIRKDRDFIKFLLSRNGFLLANASMYINDKELVLAALKSIYGILDMHINYPERETYPYISMNYDYEKKKLNTYSDEFIKVLNALKNSNLKNDEDILYLLTVFYNLKAKERKRKN